MVDANHLLVRRGCPCSSFLQLTFPPPFLPPLSSPFLPPCPSPLSSALPSSSSSPTQYKPLAQKTADSKDGFVKGKTTESPDHCVVIKYLPAAGDDKKAIDDYTSEIGMGGRNTLACAFLPFSSLFLLFSPLPLTLSASAYQHLQHLPRLPPRDASHPRPCHPRGTDDPRHLP
jgi:hypothetical protein